jgi:MFS family permease
MSFKLFIYYCALCGGWAAFAGFLLVQGTHLLTYNEDHPLVVTSFVAAILGVLLAGAVGTLDAVLNSRGRQRQNRVITCLAVGLLGGLVSGWLGEVLHEALRSVGLDLRLPGWALVGTVVGGSIGVYDLVQARRAKQHLGQAWRKLANGLIGGLVGGLIGGLLFEALARLLTLERSSLAFGLVILGGCIGLMIGLAQVILKEAWVKVEKGFRPGREMMLVKPEVTIGRAESCDIGLFGDNAVERTHARILLQNHSYYLADEGGAAGTFVNDQRVVQPTPLRSGDVIRIGGNVLRFGERRKQANGRRV